LAQAPFPARRQMRTFADIQRIGTFAPRLVGMDRNYRHTLLGGRRQPGASENHLAHQKVEHMVGGVAAGGTCLVATGLGFESLPRCR
jgi:hypothetical protein